LRSCWAPATGASAAGSHVDNEHAEEARHMFFGSATGQLAGLFATHPPLVARIRALEALMPEALEIYRRAGMHFRAERCEDRLRQAGPH
jgi:hypothetical protein